MLEVKIPYIPQMSTDKKLKADGVPVTYTIDSMTPKPIPDKLKKRLEKGRKEVTRDEINERQKIAEVRKKSLEEVKLKKIQAHHLKVDNIKERRKLSSTDALMCGPMSHDDDFLSLNDISMRTEKN